MSGLKLFLLGSPLIEYDGKPIDINRRKAVALLIYLAVTGDAHTRDGLATMLWSDFDQRRARASLRSALWDLNKTAIGPGLVVEPETVQLRVEAGLWVDATHFRQLLAACDSHGHAAHEVCPACRDPLTEAVTLYRDDFLAGFTLPDAPEFDEWQFFQSENLRQKLASALERLIRLYQAQNELAEAIPYARRWLSLDPLHEPAHRQLMLLYAQSGQQAAALRQYQVCADALEAELGLAPNQETTILYEQIRAGRLNPDQPISQSPTPVAETASPVVRSDLIPRHNLPPQPTPFIGRETELADLANLIADPNTRLLTIVGPGGMGKTRLALEAAGAQVEHYPHGVYFVPLAPLTESENLIPATAQAVNFPFPRDERSPQQQLLDYFRQKQLMLVLDNFEHLLAPSKDGLAFITDLLQAALQVKLLITSRERLKLSSETVFTLEGLDFPEREMEGSETVRWDDTEE
jgi:DNA-binding SARP family transcriptional activator